MEPTQVIELVQQMLWLTIKVSTPIMLVGLFVGLLVALFQALTQIQEITLAFVPKIIAIFMAMYLLFPTYSILLTEFTLALSDLMIGGNLDSKDVNP